MDIVGGLALKMSCPHMHVEPARSAPSPGVVYTVIDAEEWDRQNIRILYAHVDFSPSGPVVQSVGGVHSFHHLGFLFPPPNIDGPGGGEKSANSETNKQTDRQT